MDMMDIKIMIMRALKKKGPQMFILSIFLGCISAVTIIVAGVMKNLPDLLIIQRMCMMFIVITIAGALILKIIYSFFVFLENMGKRSSKTPKVQNISPNKDTDTSAEKAAVPKDSSEADSSSQTQSDDKKENKNSTSQVNPAAAG